MAVKKCFICGTGPEDAVVLDVAYGSEDQGGDKGLCLRCLHPLIHGHKPDEMIRRFEEWKKGQASGAK